MGDSKRIRCLPLLVCTSVQTALLCGAPAAAAAELEEIVVTARKREESLQDAPISITAFTADSLRARQVESIGQIAEATPNLVFDTTNATIGSSNSAQVFIRGVGQLDYTLNTDPGVGIYVDGVYVSRSVGSVLDLVDAQTVEVLRGPQGTLFGRNTIGGAINITSRKPDEEFHGTAEIETGRYDRIDGKVSINVPLAENLYSSFTALSRNRDGYVKRLQDNQDMGDQDLLAGRAALRWLPTDTLELNLSLDGTRERQGQAPMSALAINGAAPFAAFHNALIAGGSCFPPPGSTSNPACYNEQWATNDLYSTNAGFDSFSDVDLWGVSFNAEWELEMMTVRSITGYRWLDTETSRDADASPLKIADSIVPFEQDQISQEIQLLGDAFDDRLHWIIGGYYFSEDGDDEGIALFAPAEFQTGGPVSNESFAGFGQATYDLTEKLSFTAGIRYTDDTREFTPDQFVIAGPLLPPGVRLLPNELFKTSSDDTSPMVNLSYQWTDNLLTYLTYSEGYKSGGFNQRAFPPLPEPPAFGPEYVEVYEGGVKLTALDDRLRVNAAIFFSDYSDLQVNVRLLQFGGATNGIQNAGKAEIFGAELEVAWLPVDGLLLEGGFGNLDAEYTEIDPAAVEVSLDKALPNTPEWSANASISYTWALFDWGTLTPRADWSYRTRVANDAANTPLLIQDAYHLLNLGLTFETTDGRWAVTAGGRNVLDEEYITNGAVAATGVAILAVPGRPAEWALSVRYSF